MTDLNQPRYFELVAGLSKTEYKKKLPSDQRRVRSVKQFSLSHYILFAVEGAEIRQQKSQLSFTIDKSITQNRKQQNIQRFFSATASADLSEK